jgi:hypothetical protein
MAISPRLYVGTFITYFVYKKQIAHWFQCIRYISVFLLLFTGLSLFYTGSQSKPTIRFTQPESQDLLTMHQICLGIAQEYKGSAISDEIIKNECNSSSYPEFETEVAALLKEHNGSVVTNSIQFSTLKWLLQFKQQIETTTFGQFAEIQWFRDRILPFSINHLNFEEVLVFLEIDHEEMQDIVKEFKFMDTIVIYFKNPSDRAPDLKGFHWLRSDGLILGGYKKFSYAEPK